MLENPIDSSEVDIFSEVVKLLLDISKLAVI